MMTSPEYFYETFLQGKNEKEIHTVIRRLKREIGRLKNILAEPDYVCEICPSEDVQLWCTREYLEEAKKALAEVGGEYKMSKSELKVQEFNDNIPYISEIEFSIGGYLTETQIYRADLSGDDVRITSSSSFTDTENEIAISDDDKEFFFERLRDLYIGEWRKKYIKPHILDGTQWQLTIKYNNGKPQAKHYGSNAYPYSFEGLCDLFDIEFEKW